MERLADLNAPAEQLLAGGLNVGDDQVQSQGGAGRRRGDVLAEEDRASGAGRRELDHAVVVTGREVGIEPPAEAAVKSLGAIDVRNRDDDDLELHVGRPRTGAHCELFCFFLDVRHGSLLDADEGWARRAPCLSKID